MPFVALLDEVVRVDATAVEDARWTSIHRVRPRRHLSCPECGWRLQAKVLGTLRFFAHDPRAPRCSTVGESPEHQRLKRLVGDAVRKAGWDARFEEPVGARRADVLAVPPNTETGLSPVAFEVQLSPQPAPDTETRSRDYAASGVSVVWVVHDLAAIGAPGEPWMQLDEDDGVDAPLVRLARRRTSVELAGRSRRVPLAEPVWRPLAQPVALERTVAAVLDGRLWWSRQDRSWLPSSETAEYERLAFRFAEARRTAARQLRETVERETAERRRREDDRDAWRARRGRTVAVLKGRLKGGGHRTLKVVEDRRGRYAHATLIQIAHGPAFAVCPDPAQVHAGTRRKLQNLTVVAGDRTAVASLVSIGVSATVPEEVVIPPPPPPSPPPEIDGRPTVAATFGAYRRLLRMAKRADCVPGQARWSDDLGAWRVRLYGNTAVGDVALLEADADPAPSQRHALGRCLLTITGHKRDADRLRETLGHVVVAHQLTADDLAVAPTAPQPASDRTHPPGEPRLPAPTDLEEPPLMQAADDVLAALPPGAATSHRPLSAERPLLARIVHCPGGLDVVITRDASALPAGAADGRVLYILGGQAPLPGEARVALDARTAAELAMATD